MSEHAVLIKLRLSGEGFGTPQEREAIHALSGRLEQAISAAESGEFDGDEFGGGVCTLYLYGPDADRLLASVDAILRSSPLARGARVTKRYGDAGDSNAREVEVEY